MLELSLIWQMGVSSIWPLYTFVINLLFFENFLLLSTTTRHPRLTLYSECHMTKNQLLLQEDDFFNLQGV